MKRCLIFITLFFLLLIDSVAYSQSKSNVPDYIGTKPDTSVQGKNFIAAFFSIFKFKANANEKRRILAWQIIDRLEKNDINPIGNDITLLKNDIATLGTLLELRDSLLDKRSQSYDSLVLKIKAGLDSLISSQSPGTPNIPVSDKDAKYLASLIAPIITAKISEETAEKEKNEALAIIRSAIGNPNRKDIKKVNDSTYRFTTYRITKRASVMAFHRFGDADFKGNYISILDGLYYYAFSFNGATGNITSEPGWADDTAYTTARLAHKQIFFTVADKDEQNLDNLLNREGCRKIFIDNIKQLVINNNANGVNLWFQNLNASNFEKFTVLADSLKSALKAVDKTYQLNIRVSPYIKDALYDLNELANYADNLLVDFTVPFKRSPVATPTAPFKGNGDKNISNCMSSYLDQQVAPAKFVLCFSYQGANWELKNKSKQSADKFIGSVGYKNIRAIHPDAPSYNDEYVAAFIDTLKKARYNSYVERTWYDDDRTLGIKYDYLLQNKLGGVAIWKLGDDNGYGELSDVLMYKFLQVVADSTDSIAPLVIDKPLTFFQTLRGRGILYAYILKNPCVNCFEQDSAINSLSKKIGTNFKKSIGDLKTGFAILAIISVVLAAGLIFLYLRNIIANELWPYKKMVLRCIIAVIILLLVSTFSLMFVSDSIPFFGNKKAAFAGDCTADDTCINMPFFTLLFIITVAIVAGGLITKFLIVPLLKREDVP